MYKIKKVVAGENIVVEDIGNAYRIHLENSSNNVQIHQGQFQVMDNEDGTLSIFDGISKSNTFCGYTDIGYVPSATIPKQDGTLALVANYDAQTKSYNFSFQYNITLYQHACFIIAYIVDGIVVQPPLSLPFYFGVRYFV